MPNSEIINMVKNAKLSNNTPQVVIGEKGIVDNQRRIFIFIEWKDITEIWVRRASRSNYYICMNFKNPEKYQKQMSSVERVSWKPDEWAGHGHMNIGFMSSDPTSLCSSLTINANYVYGSL